MRLIPLSLLLIACNGTGSYFMQAPVLELVVDSPSYGMFAGEGPLLIEGHVNDAATTLTIEGQDVPVRADGSFSALLPLSYDYVNVDIVATLLDQQQRQRIPVFMGQDPMESWPGGLPLRLTNEGLFRLGEQLGASFDATGWSDQLGANLPAFSGGGVSLTPLGVTHAPTVVELSGDAGGIAVAISLRDLSFELDASIDVLGIELPVWLGVEEIAIGALAVPEVDERGMLTVRLVDAIVEMGDPIIQIDGWDAGMIEALVAPLGGFLQNVGDQLLDSIITNFGQLELGGPFAFDTDLLGSRLSVGVAEVYGDSDGVVIGLTMGLGAPMQPGPLQMPVPSQGLRGGDLLVGLHEAVFQTLLDSDLVDMLSQDLDLGGLFGNVLGGMITALPGGETVPIVTTGWCVDLDPGQAKVARMHERTDPLASLYFPDLRMKVGYSGEGVVCKDWLEASLAIEIDLRVEQGTRIGIDLGVAEGAVMSYAARDGSWQEDAVIDGLAGFFDSIMGLAGGQLSFDLADLAGGFSLGVGAPIAPRLIGSQLASDPDAPEGLYTLSVSLWDSP